MSSDKIVPQVRINKTALSLRSLEWCLKRGMRVAIPMPYTEAKIVTTPQEAIDVLTTLGIQVRWDEQAGEFVRLPALED